METSGDGTGDYPPPLFGDWVIANDTYVGNETIVLTGNLTVQLDASLTLNNVILKMNVSEPGGYGIRVLQGGTLKIERSNITSLIEDGNHNYGFVAEPGSNLTLLSSNIQYVGWNTDLKKGHGIILRTHNATVRECNISHSYAGITIYQVPETVTIENNTISWNKRNGITAIGSDVNLTRNTVFYNGLIMDANWGAFAGHGISLANATTGIVLDNDMNENFWDGLFVQLSSGIEIRENRFLGNQYEGAEFYLTTDILFEENNASETVLYAGLTLWYSDFNTISNNTFFANGNNGIYMFGSWNNDILNNTAIGSLRYHGFSIEECNLNNLTGNVALSVFRDGVYMGLSNMNTLTGNNLSSNGWGGIYIYEGLGENSILMNEIYDNRGEGVGIDGSSSNHIYGNNISKNGIGVLLVRSNDNMVIWNNFTSNDVQGADDIGINYWDAGYPIGGNYWDDYVGYDFFHGPGQDRPGSDRLGDTPYQVDTDTKDNYPLIGPFDPTSPGPPTNVTATLSGDDLENATIDWDLSWNDRPNGTITNYAVYCGREYDPSGANYTFLGEISAGNSSYVHANSGLGEPNSYYYIVVANNTFGKTTKGGNQAGKFTRNLEPGINLLSYPLLLEDNEMESVLRTVEFNEIWYYEPQMPVSKWKSYSKSKDHDSPFELDYRMSYWINVTSESNFTVAGRVMPRSYIVLKSGWNLVGYPSPINVTSAQSLAGIPVSDIEGFDETTSPYFLRMMDPSDEMIPGNGYWLRVDSSTTWVIDN